MAERQRIPVDGRTGIPLPLLPVEKPSHIRGKTKLTYDHMWCPHETLKLEDPEGRALRYSIGQDIPQWLHTIKNRDTEMPEIPSCIADYFRPVVFGCANQIGPYAIDLTKDDWTVPVLMTPSQYEFATDRRRMHMQDEHNPRFTHVKNRVGWFFAKHSLDHGLVHVSPETINEFLSAKHNDDRARLGNLLLRQSVDVAVEPLIPVLREVREMAPMPLETIDLRNVVHRFFIRERFGVYHETIAQKLTALQLA